jgi:branched-chain amino acid transport system substrate-binding protein
MKKFRVLAAAATLALVGVAAAGCGSSSTSASHKNEIAIGVIGSYGGSAASSVGPAKDAIQAWADAVNAAGGISGHKVHLYVKDDAGNTANSLTMMKSLVQEDHVVAIVGQASASPEAWQKYVDSKGIPIVGGNTSSSVYLADANFYSVGGNTIANYYGITQLAKSSGAKLGDLYCAEIPACATTATILKTAGSSLGVDLGFSSKVSASAADFTAPCQGLKDAGVESYTLGLASATIKQVVSQCNQQGLKAQLILANVADSSLATDPTYEGIKIIDPIFPFWDDSTPGRQAFQAAMKKYAPDLGSADKPMNAQVTQAWASGKLFEAAVKASGESTVTADSVKAGLAKIHDETFDGLTMPLTFVKGQPNPHNCWFSYDVHGGKFVAVGGLEPQCASGAAIAAILSKLG